MRKMEVQYKITVRILSMIQLYNDKPTYPNISLDFRGRLYYRGLLSITSNKFVRGCVYKRKDLGIQISDEGLAKILEYVHNICLF